LHAASLACLLIFTLLVIPALHAATPGLPFTEDFSSDALKDSSKTTADWNTDQETLVLRAWKKQFGIGRFTTHQFSVPSSVFSTRTTIASGDVNGDGNLDVITVIHEGIVIYINSGTTPFFDETNAFIIDLPAHGINAIALGDMDGDGDLDIVAGNLGALEYYKNNGTDSPFERVAATAITFSDGYFSDTISQILLGDADDDGNLDIFASYIWNKPLLYLNNGTNEPFSNVTGTVIGSGESAYSTHLALADIDNDDDLDIVIGRTWEGVLSGPAIDLYFLNNGTPAPFDGAVAKPVGTPGDENDLYYTREIILADVNRDGRVDLVTDGESQPKRIYFNNGSSEPFTNVTAYSFGDPGLETISITLGDMDGDGDLDLLEANTFPAHYLYLNDGSETAFSNENSVTITESYAKARLVTGDVDNDGDLDILEASSDLGVDPTKEFAAERLFLNNLTENPFDSLSGNIGPGDKGDFIADVAVGDVDNDGDLDVVTGNRWYYNRLYLNNGTPTPFIDIVTGTPIGTGDQNDTTSVALGDIDNDGDLDLVAGNYTEFNLLYLNNGGPDPFSGIVNGIAIGSDQDATEDIALGDLDLDGDLDIVVGNSADNDDGQPNKYYLNNQVSPLFADVSSGSPIGTGDSDITRAIALADMDLDGDLDVVAGNMTGQNKLYLNAGPVTLFDTLTSGLPVGAESDMTTSLVVADLDRDGDPDIVAGNNTQHNRYYPNTLASPMFSDTASGIPMGTGDTDLTQVLAAVDVDRDGDIDIVAGNAYQRQKLYLNNGTDTPFADIVTGDPILTGDIADGTSGLSLGDLDGNGYPDLVIGGFNEDTNYYILNIGGTRPFNGANTGEAVGSGDTEWSYSFDVGDVDNDGDLDLVVGNYGGYNRLYLNDGTDTPFDSIVNGDVIGTADTDNTTAVSLVDLDNDGDLDLVAGNYEQVNRYYLNNGTLTPFSGIANGAPVAAFTGTTRAIAVADMDNDGDMDVVEGNYAQATRLYRNDGNGDSDNNPFTGLVDGQSITAAAFTYGIALGDMDGDGDVDVVSANYGEENLVHWNIDQASSFTHQFIDVSETDNSRAVALGDMDGDGDLDIAMANEGVNILYLNTGTSFTDIGPISSPLAVDSHNTFSIALADSDLDGDLDVLAGNWGQENRLYLNYGPGTYGGFQFENVTVGNVATAMTGAIGMTDMDNDGDQDLLFTNGGQLNTYIPNHRFDTSGNIGGSLDVDTLGTGIPAAILAVTDTTPPNTSIDYFLSNDGGAHYFQVKPNVAFSFPTAGTDLRWKARLNSLSPVQTPAVNTIHLDRATPLSLSLSPDSLYEDAPDATATIALPRGTLLPFDLTITLASNDTTAATVQSSVVLPAFAARVSVPVDVVDDIRYDGTQYAEIRASAPGMVDGTDILKVLDNESTYVESITMLDPSPTKAAEVRYRVTFSDSIAGLGATNFGLAFADLTDPLITAVTDDGDGTAWTVTVNTGSGSGIAILHLLSDDGLSRSLADLPYLGTAFYIIDKEAPTVTITTTATDPTRTSPLLVTITFSEPVSDLTLADLSITNGTAANLSGDGITWTVEITPTGTGEVILSIDGGVVTDAVGNSNSASAPLGVTYWGKRSNTLLRLMIILQ
jgi:hypothetical protein